MAAVTEGAAVTEVAAAASAVTEMMVEVAAPVVVAEAVLALAEANSSWCMAVRTPF